ncbi:unnamed protein product [Albugo candida]|uniref:Uncharacterized protein n=1 Tax=Albugo candida TaxID=65357 RepID=A0A024GPE9_9STRA|nr:unnamed protein product [Albugo candida]|eukprot:CCI48762.1 unnamed protein product [Albugo candida]
MRKTKTENYILSYTLHDRPLYISKATDNCSQQHICSVRRELHQIFCIFEYSKNTHPFKVIVMERVVSCESFSERFFFQKSMYNKVQLKDRLQSLQLSNRGIDFIA